MSSHVQKPYIVCVVMFSASITRFMPLW